VQLPLQAVAPPGPSFENLEILLKQTLGLSDFDGTAALYLLDLQMDREIYFALREGEALPIPPDVAFTGASIIKIPIMVSVFRRLEGNLDRETDRLLRAMIAESGNESADWVMERVIDPETGPLEVTGDMRALGLENTFLAGFFHLGAPLLAVYETPANRRIDSGIDPDIYNQTTPAEIGRLLADITTCSRSGSGRLVETFRGEITQAECQAMLNYLAANKTPFLIEAGVPETVQVIHKHGWVSLFGIINTIGDAALVSSPGGDYVLVVYLYHPELLLWDPASALVSSLSQAVFNFFNFQ
jgi:beta-lactamase class A